MKLGERTIGAIVAFVTILATLLTIALLESHSEAKVGCVSAEDREHILKMSLQAVDQGFEKHVVSLYGNWVVDASQQPSRAQVGMQNGIRAWLRAQDDAKKWTPPVC